MFVTNVWYSSEYIGWLGAGRSASVNVHDVPPTYGVFFPRGQWSVGVLFYFVLSCFLMVAINRACITVPKFVLSPVLVNFVFHIVQLASKTDTTALVGSEKQFVASFWFPFLVVSVFYAHFFTPATNKWKILLAVGLQCACTQAYIFFRYTCLN